MRKTVIGVALAALATLSFAGVRASEGKVEAQHWTFGGLFGTFDQAQLQRGLQVYREVCSSCHSLRLVSYRDLAAIGIPEDTIKEIAGESELPGEPDVDGEPTTRPALPSDKFVPPFKNEQAAKASNNGSLPPDLSLMIKARKGGPDYLYGLLTGYEEEAPEGFEIGEGLNFNRVFPGNQIAMAAPLADDAVEYADGTKASAVQLAGDVTAFLTWAAQPELGTRKRMGIKVVLFLILFTGLLYAVKKKVWADLH